MNLIYLKNMTQKAPINSGIYIFKNTKNKPLYIGKALNLKNRVKSYLKTSDTRLQKMISEAKKLDFITTDSEIEALILESQYIKKYQPPFNVTLRDDKQYGFVAFSEEKYPKIFITHQPQKSESRIVNSELRLEKSLFHNSKLTIHNSSYIGPFTDIGALRTTLKLLRRIFPYCTCKQTHNNYCLNYHINKCLGFCCLKKPVNDKQQLTAYNKNIKSIKDILSGKKSSLIKNLEKEMKNLSKHKDYEKALELQHKIGKLKHIFQNAQILNTKFVIRNTENEQNNSIVLKQLARTIGLERVPQRIECYDVANIQGKHAVGAMVVFIDGAPDKNQYRKFKIYTEHNPNDTAMLGEILSRRFNHPEWPHPDLIVVDGGKAQLNAAKEVLRIKNYVLRIPVIALTKNEYHIGHKIILDTGKEIFLSKLPVQIKNFLLNIDSEAHRFAISYYRKVHRKTIN